MNFEDSLHWCRSHTHWNMNVSQILQDLIERVKVLEDRNSLLNAQNCALKVLLNKVLLNASRDRVNKKARLHHMPVDVLREIFSFVSNEEKGVLMKKSVEDDEDEKELLLKKVLIPFLLTRIQYK